MIYQNLEFHNVEQLEEKPGMPGLFLQRLPESIRNSLGFNGQERGRYFAQISSGCEIRFVTEATVFRISVSAWECDGKVSVYLGDFFYGTYDVVAGKITTIQLEYPDRFRMVELHAIKSGRFSSDVWRICFDRSCCYSFNGIETFGGSLRPPLESEKPKLRWLAYGSSITMGGNCEKFSNCYVERAARILGAEVINKSMSGACFIDAQIAAYLASFRDWDFASLELGINMLSRFNPDEFGKRVENILIKMARHKKPVFITDIFPSYNQYSLNNAMKDKNATFNKIVLDKIMKVNSSDLYFIKGSDILSDFSDLSCDLLHPSDEGHIQMGENFARIAKNILESNVIIGG